MKIGFIGLGKIGNPIVKNLIKDNHELHVYDINKVAIEKLISFGAKSCIHPAEVADNTEIIMLSLPKAKNVMNVLEGKNGILKGKIVDKIIINYSTNNPESSRKMGDLLAKHFAHWIEAPISGGIKGAENNALTIMVSGDIAQFKKVLPILNAISKEVFYTGQIGSALLIKLINQLIYFNNLVTIREAFNFASKLNVNFEKKKKIVSQSSGSSYALNKIYQHYFNINANTRGHPVELLNKDMNIIKDLAKNNKENLPIANIAKDTFQCFIDNGYGKEDIINIIFKADAIFTNQL